VKTELKKLGLGAEQGKLIKTVEADPVPLVCWTAKQMILKIQACYPGIICKLFLTSNDKSNYRFEVAKTVPYKGNRVAPKPHHYNTIREYLISRHKAVVIEGKEADD
jgi:hypothetical protein